jgi:hypothetical protein
MRFFVTIRIGIRVTYDLYESLTISEVNKYHPPMISPSVHPSHEDYFETNM